MNKVSYRFTIVIYGRRKIRSPLLPPVLSKVPHSNRPKIRRAEVTRNWNFRFWLCYYEELQLPGDPAWIISRNGDCKCFIQFPCMCKEMRETENGKHRKNRERDRCMKRRYSIIKTSVSLTFHLSTVPSLMKFVLWEESLTFVKEKFPQFCNWPQHSYWIFASLNFSKIERYHFYQA